MKNKISATGKIYSYIKRHLIENEILLAILSGLLLFLSFPKYGFGAMAWVAFIPLLFAISNTDSMRRALTLGFVTGVVAYVGIIYWITYVVVDYGYLPVYLGVIIMLLLASYLSIYIALFAAGVYFLQKKMTLCLTSS